MRHIDAIARLIVVVMAAGMAAAHAEPRSTYARRNVAIVLYYGVELLDFAGPTEVFTAAGSFGAFRVYTVAATRDPITSQNAVRAIPDFSVDDAPAPDILVLPGGNSTMFSRSSKAMAWVDRVARKNELSMSVCSGAFILARLGLLEASPPHPLGCAARAPGELPGSRRVRRALRRRGRDVTTAGVSAGIDGALHVVQRLLGDDAAWETARYMQYDHWEPAESSVLSKQSKEALRALVFQDADKANRLLAAEVAASPKDPGRLSRLGRAQLLRGPSAQGVATLEKAVALGQRDPLTLSVLADAQLARGAFGPAAATYEQLVAIRGAPFDAYGLACARARQGQTDPALAALEQSVQLGLQNPDHARTDDDLASLRGHPRFAQILSGPRLSQRPQ
jgi:transcriptional regulator GlxA family with amidase domain